MEILLLMFLSERASSRPIRHQQTLAYKFAYIFRTFAICGLRSIYDLIIHSGYQLVNILFEKCEKRFVSFLFVLNERAMLTIFFCKRIVNCRDLW